MIIIVNIKFDTKISGITSLLTITKEWENAIITKEFWKKCI